MKIGSEVKSNYKARWKGTVIAINNGVCPMYNTPHYIAEVLVHTDQKGNPIRKPFKKNLDIAWLEEL